MLKKWLLVDSMLVSAYIKHYIITENSIGKAQPIQYLEYLPLFSQHQTNHVYLHCYIFTPFTRLYHLIELSGHSHSQEVHCLNLTFNDQNFPTYFPFISLTFIPTIWPMKCHLHEVSFSHWTHKTQKKPN